MLYNLIPLRSAKSITSHSEPRISGVRSIADSVSRWQWWQGDRWNTQRELYRFSCHRWQCWCVGDRWFSLSDQLSTCQPKHKLECYTAAVSVRGSSLTGAVLLPLFMVPAISRKFHICGTNGLAARPKCGCALRPRPYIFLAAPRCRKEKIWKHHHFVHTKALVEIVPNPYSFEVLHAKYSIFSNFIHSKEMSLLICWRSIKTHSSCPEWIIAYTCGIKWTLCPSEFGFPKHSILFFSSQRILFWNGK